MIARSSHRPATGNASKVRVFVDIEDRRYRALSLDNRWPGSPMRRRSSPWAKSNGCSDSSGSATNGPSPITGLAAGNFVLMEVADLPDTIKPLEYRPLRYCPKFRSGIKGSALSGAAAGAGGVFTVRCYAPVTRRTGLRNSRCVRQATVLHYSPDPNVGSRLPSPRRTEPAPNPGSASGANKS